MGDLCLCILVFSIERNISSMAVNLSSTHFRLHCPEHGNVSHLISFKLLEIRLTPVV